MKRVKFVLVREQLRSYKMVGDKVRWRQAWRQGTAAYKKQNGRMYRTRQAFMIAALVTILVIILLCSLEVIPAYMSAVAVVLLITSICAGMAQVTAIDAQVVHALNRDSE